MKKLMIFGASEFQIPLILAAKKERIHTCVIDINPQAPACEFADVYYECSLKDYEKALSIAEEYKPDGITAGMCDVAVLSVALICEKLGLPGISKESAIKSTDKFAMIQAFSKANVPCPTYRRFTRGERIDEASALDVPFIVKPIDMAGSRGINLVKSYDDMDSLVMNSISASDSGSIIMEEYMVGPEVSVEIVVKDYQPHVLQITDKITSGAPHFVEIGHIQPSVLPSDVLEAVSRVAGSAVQAVGLKDSIVHAEVIITDQGPKMVELGARMGGDGIQQQLLRLSTGIDLNRFAIDLAFGLPLSIPSRTMNKFSMIRFIPSQVGVISDIQIDDAISTDPNLVTYKLFCNRGDFFSERNDNSGRFGYVISQADNRQTVLESCQRAISRIKINME